MITEKLIETRSDIENNLRTLLGRPVMVTELDAFALPCGCNGITANIRGLELDDIEIFEEQMLAHFKEAASRLEIPPSFIFARLVPGSSVVAAINWRVLCDRCYPEFARTHGKMPRPDIYIVHLERREGGGRGKKKQR
ncbi:MAG: DUF5402 family protein [Euryarchaeota archaeon]|nr:DUF5402 family protein [Euryarchaeota archaeon]